MASLNLVFSYNRNNHQRDSNLGNWRKRQVRWPLDHNLCSFIL